MLLGRRSNNLLSSPHCYQTLLAFAAALASAEWEPLLICVLALVAVVVKTVVPNLVLALYPKTVLAVLLHRVAYEHRLVSCSVLVWPCPFATFGATW